MIFLNYIVFLSVSKLADEAVRSADPDTPALKPVARLSFLSCWLLSNTSDFVTLQFPP